MTWEEFKKRVDAEIERKGIPKNIPIIYIDVQWDIDDSMVSLVTRDGKQYLKIY
jgi:hypothetical protein